MSITVHGLVGAELSRKSGTLYVQAVEEWLSRRDTGDLNVEVELHINHYSGRKARSSARRILLLIEPTVTWPRNRLYREEDYDQIFAAGPMRCAEYLGWFHEPLKVAPTVSEAEFRNRESKFTIIAANKMSFVEGELYSLRRQVVLNHPLEIDLYGFDWNNSLGNRLRTLTGEFLHTAKAKQPVFLDGSRGFLRDVTNYIGMAQEKVTPYSSNKFALVIENSLELRTEKLYDAVEAGAIPVYVGPKVPEDVPKDLFVHADAGIKGIIEGMRQVKEINPTYWLRVREEWMKTPGYLRNSKERFFLFLDDLITGLETK